MSYSEILLKAELSLASYAFLTTARLDSQKPSLATVGILESQANVFTSQYNVVTQYADTLTNGGMGTGLNATVFADAGGRLTLAIRGTDSLGIGGDASDLASGQDNDMGTEPNFFSRIAVSRRRARRCHAERG